MSQKILTTSEDDPLFDLLSPPAIRRATDNAEFKLFVKLLWLSTGCCLLPQEVSPRAVGCLGFVDTQRDLVNWLDRMKQKQWAAVERTEGRWWQVTFNEAIFCLPKRSESGQLLLNFDEPPEAFGANPQLVPLLLPERLLSDDDLSAAVKFFSLYALAKVGFRAWSVEIHYEHDRREIGRDDAKSIRDYLKAIRPYMSITKERGRCVLSFQKSMWLPSQLQRMQLAQRCDFNALASFVPLVESGSNGEPAPVAHQTPVLEPGSNHKPAPDAHSSPVLLPDKPGSNSQPAPVGHNSPVLEVGENSTQPSWREEFEAELAKRDASPSSDTKNPRTKNISNPSPRHQEPRTQEERSRAPTEAPIGDALADILNDPARLKRLREESIAGWRERIERVVKAKEKELQIGSEDDRRLKPRDAQAMAQAIVNADGEYDDQIDTLLASLPAKKESDFSKGPAAWLIGCFQCRNLLPKRDPKGLPK